MMYIKPALLISLLFSLITTNHPYYPITTGKSITYQVYNIIGEWHNPTKELWIYARAYAGVETVTFGKTTCPSFFGSAELYAESFNGTHPLQEGGAAVGNVQYIGEAINHMGQVMVPFEPKLTIQPVAGQVIPPTMVTTYSGENLCNSNPANAEKSYSYFTYRTIGWYPNWGVFPDVWRTSLHECGAVASCAPTPGQMVYNYAFMRGVGMVDFWFGVLGQNNSVIGKEYYAVGW